MFDSKAMQLFTFFHGFGGSASLEEGRECVVIREKSRRYNLSKQRNHSEWGIRARVASSQGVEHDNVELRNLVEQLVCIVHGGGGIKFESAEVDKLREDRDVILEMSFDSEGLDLLELRERVAIGYEREGSI